MPENQPPIFPPANPPSDSEPLKLPDNLSGLKPKEPKGHVCGPSCNHDHAPKPAVPKAPADSGASSGHTHSHTSDSHSYSPSIGDGHSHSHHHHHEPHTTKPPIEKPKWGNGWKITGIMAAVAVGFYLINEYGKPKKNEKSEAKGDWSERVTKAAEAEARQL